MPRAIYEVSNKDGQFWVVCRVVEGNLPIDHAADGVLVKGPFGTEAEAKEWQIRISSRS